MDNGLSFATYEISMKLRAIEFDYDTNYFYDHQRFKVAGYHSNFDYYLSHHDDFCTAPTMEQVDNWLLDQKIMILVTPIDDWGHWSVRIFQEDVMKPFFQIYPSSKAEIEFSTKQDAFWHAVEWILNNNLINLTGPKQK